MSLSTRSKKLTLETLETRQMMAVDILSGSASSSVTISSGSSSDYIPAIVQTAETLEIRGANGDDVGYAWEYGERLYGYLNGTIRSFLKNTISQVSFVGYGGDDLFVNYSMVDSLMRGGAGNDRLIGYGARDILLGEDGNDYLVGGHHQDTLVGGNGDDTLYGQYGDDLLVGDAGNDLLYGGEGNDTIYAGAGNDQLFGEAGNDRLEGQLGTNVIYGGVGNDWLVGGSETDYLLGEQGQDTLQGLGGHDWLAGGDGDDHLAGGDGNDRLWGQSGNDILSGDQGHDSLNGGDGNDYLGGMDGHDAIYGNAGHDRIYGGDGNDYLRGDSGNDTIYGEQGRDTLYGDDGNDGLFGGLAVGDTLNGGRGADRLLVPFAYPAAIDTIQDFQPEDAAVVFVNLGTTEHHFKGESFEIAAGRWTESEIQRVDVALANLHDRTGNTKLLKKANGGTLIIGRAGSVPSNLNSNIGGWNNGHIIALTSTAFTYNFQLWSTVYHEVAHNWDDPIESPYATSFRNISRWDRVYDSGDTPSGDGQGWFYHDVSTNFARPYGTFNPQEDYATTWETYFMGRYHNTVGTDNVVAAKLRAVDAFFESIG